MTVKRQVLSEIPADFPFPYTIVRAIPGRGVEVDIEFPDPPKTHDLWEAIKRICAKLDVDVSDL